MISIWKLYRSLFWVLLFAAVLTACGERNEGFAIPPFEDIESIAFIEHPEARLISERTSSESSYRTLDSGRVCNGTASFRTYEFVEPVLFSELQNFYNDLAVEAGWEIENLIPEAAQQIGVHPNYIAIKQINGRSHDFTVFALQPDGLGTFQVGEDQPVIGYRLTYIIRPDPEHPFC